MVSKKILPSQRVLVEVRSNFHLYFQSKVHDNVLVLVRTGKHEICGVTPKKSALSASTRCTETIETEKYSAFTAVIRFKAVNDVGSIKV